MTDLENDDDSTKHLKEFVDHLERLTLGNKVVWSQSEYQTGFVRCRIEQEFLEFEVLGGKDAELVSPIGEVHGIHCRCRNVKYLWLEGSNGWDQLLKILRNAPIDDAEFRYCKSFSFDLPTRVLAAI